MRYVHHFRNLFDRFGNDVNDFSLAHSQVFVLSLYKRDDTRMVGRPVISTTTLTIMSNKNLVKIMKC